MSTIEGEYNTEWNIDLDRPFEPYLECTIKTDKENKIFFSLVSRCLGIISLFSSYLNQ